MNIMIALNAGYLYQAKIMLFSLAQHTNRELNVYLLHSSLTERELTDFSMHLQGKCHGVLHAIHVDRKLFEGAALNTHFTQEIYYRLVLPKLFADKEEIEKILYLDSDMVILKNIDSLYDIDFKDNLAVVCEDMSGGVVPGHRTEIGLAEDYRYFNSGMILFNVRKIREEYHENFLLDCMRSLNDVLMYPDQDVLNVMFEGKVIYVPTEVYNFQSVYSRYMSKTEMEEVLNKAAILHFSSDIKPWTKASIYRNPCGKIYWQYVCKNGDWIKYIKFRLFQPFLIIGNRVWGFIKRKIYYAR